MRPECVHGRAGLGLAGLLACLVLLWPAAPVLAHDCPECHADEAPSSECAVCLEQEEERERSAARRDEARRDRPPADPPPPDDIPAYEELPGPRDAPRQFRTRVEFRADGWYARPRGEALAEEGGAGSEVDLNDFRWMSQYEGSPWAQISIWPDERLVIRGQWFAATYHTEDRTDETIIYDGQTIPAGTRTDSTLEVIEGSIEMEGIFHAGKHVDLGFPFGIRYQSIRTRFSPEGGEAATRRVGVTLPYLGLSMSIRPTRSLSLYARTEFFAFAADDVEAAFFEFEGGATVRLGPVLALRAAWRYLALDIERWRDEGFGDKRGAIVELGGPTLSVALRF